MPEYLCTLPDARPIVQGNAGWLTDIDRFAVTLVALMTQKRRSSWTTGFGAHGRGISWRRSLGELRTMACPVCEAPVEADCAYELVDSPVSCAGCGTAFVLGYDIVWDPDTTSETGVYWLRIEPARPGEN